jgi:hypothetical protein
MIWPQRDVHPFYMRKILSFPVCFPPIRRSGWPHLGVEDFHHPPFTREKDLPGEERPVSLRVPPSGNWGRIGPRRRIASRRSTPSQPSGHSRGVHDVKLDEAVQAHGDLCSALNGPAPRYPQGSLRFLCSPGAAERAFSLSHLGRHPSDVSPPSPSEALSSSGLPQ